MKLGLYADNTTGYCSSTCPTILQFHTNDDLAPLNNWLADDYFHCSFSYIGCRLWNSLPQYIRDIYASCISIFSYSGAPRAHRLREILVL